jgi:general secretion pathway protein A
MPHDSVYYRHCQVWMTPSGRFLGPARPAIDGEDGFRREHMYPQFFGFDKLPFRLRPDPDFLYSGQEYLRARTKLIDDLRGKSRIVLLSGPAGVGKTLLLEDVLREVGGQFALCRINQPHISATELLQALLLQLGAPSADGDADRVRPFAELAAALGTAAREALPLLIIDEAQWLAGATLRAFGDILARAPRLKILLAFRHGLELRAENFAARAGLSEKPRQIELHPFSAEATKSYIERRLAVAGGAGKELFEADAYAMIHRHTDGAARLINVLCDAALHAACMRASGHVGPAEISLATQDSRWPEAVARDKAIPNAPAAHARLIVTRGAVEIAAWPLTPGRLSIGRATDNEVQLEARYISRHHCMVETVGDVSTVEDLGSVNGISVNGKPVKHHILEHEDRIALGEHSLTYLVN